MTTETWPIADFHINTGGGTHVRRAEPGCPVCGIKDAPIVRYIAGSPYYDASETCTVCGDSWSDGFLGERPFRRGWRQESIAKAAADWESACTCDIKRDDEMYVLPCEHEAAATA